MSLTPERAANLAENPHAGQGAVMLDIGGDIGAVVVHLPASLEGAEIEVEALDGQVVEDTHDHDHGHAHPHDHAHEHGHDHGHGAGPHRPHVAVVGRPAPDGEVLYSAVFPSLASGRYRLHEAESGVRHDIHVVGGEVTELDWAGPEPTDPA